MEIQTAYILILIILSAIVSYIYISKNAPLLPQHKFYDNTMRDANTVSKQAFNIIFTSLCIVVFGTMIFICFSIMYG